MDTREGQPRSQDFSYDFPGEETRRLTPMGSWIDASLTRVIKLFLGFLEASTLEILIFFTLRLQSAFGLPSVTLK
jgi:hypothetical protein